MAKRTPKRTSRARPTKARQNARQQTARNRALAEIEEFLGEDFDSLAEAKRALKTQTGPAPRKDSYTVKELSSKKHETIKTFVTDLEEHQAEIDSLKAPPDLWAARIYGHGTYQLYGSIEQLAKKLASYKDLVNENPKDALKNIQIVRVHGVNGAEDYFNQKKREVQEQWAIRKLKAKTDRARKRKQARALEKAKTQLKAHRRTIRQQAKRLAELESALKKKS